MFVHNNTLQLDKLIKYLKNQHQALICKKKKEKKCTFWKMCSQDILICNVK